jgi:beta-phosphoglucomutase
MDLQAIIFDFDGVLADTEPLHFKVFQEELADLGLSLSSREYLDRYLGYTDREVFEAVARDAGVLLSAAHIDRLVTRKSRRIVELVESTPVVYAGVASRVRDWSEVIPLAIASGALRGEIDTMLDAAGLTSCFRVIVSANDPVEGKPSPQPYRLAMARLAEQLREPVDPGRCAAIEDSVWGIAAARSAGMRVIGVTSSYPAESLREAHLVVDSVGSLSLSAVNGVIASV